MLEKKFNLSVDLGVLWMTKNEMFEFLSNGIPINGRVIIETTYRVISGVLIAMNDTALLLDCGKVTELIPFDSIITIKFS